MACVVFNINDPIKAHRIEGATLDDSPLTTLSQLSVELTPLANLAREAQEALTGVHSCATSSVVVVGGGCTSCSTNTNSKEKRTKRQRCEGLLRRQSTPMPLTRLGAAKDGQGDSDGHSTVQQRYRRHVIGSVPPLPLWNSQQRSRRQRRSSLP